MFVGIDAASFTVTSGPTVCRVIGNCVQSYDYPSKYGNNQRCSIRIDAATRLFVIGFEFESPSYDWMMLKGTKYSRAQGPNSVLVSAGDVMDFRTDGSVTYKGFKICHCPSITNGICTDCSSSTTCTTMTCNSGYYNPNLVISDGCEWKLPTVAGATCTACSTTGTCTAITACNSGKFNANGLISDGCEMTLPTIAGATCTACSVSGVCTAITACTSGKYNIDGFISNGCEASACSNTDRKNFHFNYHDIIFF